MSEQLGSSFPSFDIEADMPNFDDISETSSSTVQQFESGYDADEQQAAASGKFSCESCSPCKTTIVPCD